MAIRVIISGGGTGGHIFPAIAIAQALGRIAPDTEILFVGANGRMEMEKVPAAGYRIVGLDIQGFNRQSLWKNIGLPFKLLCSIRKSGSILREFKPDVVVGVGGYASGPLLLAARRARIPYLIQEQNSYAGITNKRLGSKAAKICVAFEGMERFFPQEKLLLTGNPIRRSSVAIESKREQAFAAFGLDPAKRTILVTGGSLGAKTLNDCMEQGLAMLMTSDTQLIWQCGAYYYEGLKKIQGVGIRVYPFLKDMDLAYAAADLIIARAGAGTIAELCVVAKPVILVPSPHVAEDHQTKNAQALVRKNAAMMVPDADARLTLLDTALSLLDDAEMSARFSVNLRKMALHDADEVIAKEVLKLANVKEYGD